MAGNLTIESCGSWFAQSIAQASSNYGIGSDGRIGMYVEEKDRSWCTSSPINDNQAITIEVANSEIGGNWPVSDKAFASLVELCTDICKRNSILSLNYDGTTNGNVTTHDMYKNKVCCGPYLKGKLPELCRLVNAKLNNSVSSIITQSAASAYIVKVTTDNLNIRNGAGTNYSIIDVIKDKGIYTILQERTGQGSAKGWGWLKSGAGWISLDFTIKI